MNAYISIYIQVSSSPLALEIKLRLNFFK
jgi:hypothetical protein